MSNNNLKFLDFQLEGINFIESHGGSCYLSDEMGLGKTAQSIGYINNHPEFSNIIIVCPASLKRNWFNEFSMWSVNKKDIYIINPDGKFDIKKEGIYIINYDLIKKFNKILSKKKWDFVVLDECTQISNNRSSRTKNTLKVIRGCKRVLALSGTPIMNRPIEGFTIFSLLDKENFGDYRKYVNEFCDCKYLYVGNNRTILSVSGSKNLNVLHDRLKGIMLRRLKKEVLKELPEKRRQIIEIPSPDKTYSQLELKFKEKYKNLTKEDLLKADLKIEMLSEIGVLRLKAALDKLPECINFINGIIEEDKKVVIFAHHSVISEALESAYGEKAVCITGETPVNERQYLVDKFQIDNKIKVFIGSIRAAGMGLTLTSASDIVFVEQDWVPSWMNQCEDRCLRIGQKNAVNVYNLVLESSIEKYMMKIVMEKQENIDIITGDLMIENIEGFVK